MNIFVLDLDPKKAAKYHNNKHVVKMPTESCQLLCSVHHMISDRTDIPYRFTHKNNPCLLWAKESLSNYMWLLELARSLLDEYTHRYDKKHKTEIAYNWLVNNIPNIQDKGLTDFPLIMPDEYKSNDIVESYRLLYNKDKLYFCEYKRRNKPYWLNL